MSPEFHKFWCTTRVSDGFALALGDRNTFQPCLTKISPYAGLYHISVVHFVTIIAVSEIDLDGICYHTLSIVLRWTPSSRSCTGTPWVL